MPPFGKNLFWDTSPELIDWEKHRGFVIGRVLNRGRLSDWEALKEVYSLDIIREEVTRIRDLSPRAVSFCRVVFDLRKDQFRCQNPNSF